MSGTTQVNVDECLSTECWGRDLQGKQVDGSILFDGFLPCFFKNVFCWVFDENHGFWWFWYLREFLEMLWTSSRFLLMIYQWFKRIFQWFTTAFIIKFIEIDEIDGPIAFCGQWLDSVLGGKFLDPYAYVMICLLIFAMKEWQFLFGVSGCQGIVAFHMCWSVGLLKMPWI